MAPRKQKEIELDLLLIGSGVAAASFVAAINLPGLKVGCLAKQSQNEGWCGIESIHPGLLSLVSNNELANCYQEAKVGTYSGIFVGDDFQRLSPNEEDWYGLHLDRRILNIQLAQFVKNNVAYFAEGDEIQHIEKRKTEIYQIITKSGMVIRTAYLVDCSGSSRFLGRYLKLREQKYSEPLFVTSYLKKAEGLTKEPRFIKTETGWVWQAPLENGKEVVTKLCERRISVDQNAVSTNMRWRKFSVAVSDRCYLLGDAFCSFDPSSGQGILFAVMSAIKAFQCISYALNSKDDSLAEREYSFWATSEFERKFGLLDQYHGSN